ncbi:MAG: ATP-binding protein [Woeseiaceae bacterium]
MSFFTWEAVESQSQELRQELLTQGRSLASLMVVASTNAILAEDLASLAEVTRRVGEQSDVAYGEIVDVRGYVMASTEEGRVGDKVGPVNIKNEQFPLVDADRILDLREDVRIGDSQVGFVRLGLLTDNLVQALINTRNRGLLSIILALIIGSIAAWILSLAVTRNLHELTAAAAQIGGGDLDVRVKELGRDETATLARAFNLMAASLHRNSIVIEQEHRKRTNAERLACVGEMAASIAHEIRNPLAALINSVQLLGRPGLAVNEHEQVVDIVNKESQRLQRILNDFLSFASLPSSVIEAHDINILIEETAELISRDPDCGEGIIIERHYDNDDLCKFDWDQLRQVVLNIMLNAVQSIQDEGRLIINVKREGKNLSISLTDSGVGISEDMMFEVLKPFVTSRKGGTGLGLSIVQRILIQHGTSLTITSTKGVGTEVAFELEAIN